MAKNLRRAKRRLQKRIAGYEETVKSRTDHGKGFRRPGRMKSR